MKYLKLDIDSMPLNKWQIFNWDDYILIDSKFNNEDKISEGQLYKISKNDYSILNQKWITFHFISYFKESLFLANKETKNITEISLIDFTTKKTSGDKIPKHFYRSSVCYHNFIKKTYQVYNNENDLLNEFKIDYPNGFKCCNDGILIWQNDKKEDNWIECIIPETKEVRWKINLKWQFVRIEIFKNRIVIEYNAYDKIRSDKGYEGQRDWYNPNKSTICFDTQNGNIVWQYEFVFSQIDKANETVLSGGNEICEVELKTGSIINCINVKPVNDLGYVPHFGNSTGYFYIKHKGQFGKINKINGNIEWEYKLIDEKGAERNLTDWYILKDEKLVLRTLPNHKNGDFTCIFNPQENLEYLVKENKNDV